MFRALLLPVSKTPNAAFRRGKLYATKDICKRSEIKVPILQANMPVLEKNRSGDKVLLLMAMQIEAMIELHRLSTVAYEHALRN